MSVINGNNTYTAPAEIGTNESKREDQTVCHREAANKGSSCSKQESMSTRTHTHSGLRSDKRMVRFHINHNVQQRIDNPPASDMTHQEKQLIWYHADDYVRFKYEAVKHAGVKITQESCDKFGQNDQFGMMGDFDTKAGEVDVSSNSAMKDTNAGKCYYNENEYKDHTNGHEVICKRGLGYHFSHNRKKSRVVTQSAVMAWQKTLRDNSSNQPICFNTKLQKILPVARTNDDLSKLDKLQIMLALVSKKCSRVARAEAEWRANVDYRVAYPCHSNPSLKSPETRYVHLNRNRSVVTQISSSST